jgi:hypothetical protein
MNFPARIGRVIGAAAFALPAVLVAGCASTEIRAQWADPQFSNRPLQGARVMVVCEARETAIRRVCADQFNQQLRAAGADPVAASDPSGTPLEDARALGAKAVMSSSIAPGPAVVAPSSSIGIGVGSWGSSVGTSVGVSVPVGGQRVDTSYGADLVLTDVASGQMMWTSSIATPASRDVNAQVASIAKVAVEAAKKAGLF